MIISRDEVDELQAILSQLAATASRMAEQFDEPKIIEERERYERIAGEFLTVGRDEVAPEEYERLRLLALPAWNSTNGILSEELALKTCVSWATSMKATLEEFMK